MLCLPTPQKKRKPKMIYDKGAGEKKGGKTKRKPKQIKQEHWKSTKTQGAAIKKSVELAGSRKPKLKIQYRERKTQDPKSIAPEALTRAENN